MYNSKISGLGMYVPENVVTNDDLSKKMDTSSEWIIERTGIKERRHIKKGDGNTTATMGVEAAKIAMKRAGVEKNDIDLILFATLSPDYYFPGSGVLAQELLDIPTCPAMDIRNQCSGFIYAISTADQYIKSGMYNNILVIGSENHSGGLDMTTRGRGVSVIFGDGAGAAVVSREEDLTKGILSSHLHSEGKHAEPIEEWYLIIVFIESEHRNLESSRCHSDRVSARDREGRERGRRRRRRKIRAQQEETVPHGMLLSILAAPDTADCLVLFHQEAGFPCLTTYLSAWL